MTIGIFALCSFRFPSLTLTLHLSISLSATKQKQNNYPLTVVSESSMERLVELLVELLLLVLPRDAEEQLNRISFRKEK
jgi:hypothetical protein